MDKKLTRRDLIVGGTGIALAGTGGFELISRLGKASNAEGAEASSTSTTDPSQHNISVYYPSGSTNMDLSLGRVNRVIGAFALPNAHGEITPIEPDSLGVTLGEKVQSTEVVLAIGGWGEYDTEWNAVADNPTKFAQSASDLKDYWYRSGGIKLVGFDLDIENLANGQLPVKMVNSLATALKNKMPGVEVTVAVPADVAKMDGDVSNLGEYIDEVGIMSYDKAGNWSDTAQDMAPGIGTIEDVSAWVDAGVDQSQVRALFPTYGRYFMGAEKKGDAFNNPQGDNAILFTDIPKGADDLTTLSSWASSGDKLISYNSPKVIGETALRLYQKYPNLAGVGFWSLDGLTDAHINAVAA